ncbi:MAG: ADP-ribosylglycohydrolase family protein [Clostridia bacterium]|nr:ADP-ribosylglycohydrolase family protein [Clostridia bacterium]
MDISSYHDLFATAAKMHYGCEKEQVADAVFNVISNASMMKDYPYDEPSDLESIKSLRKEHEFDKKCINGDIIHSKIEGAWLGRICGCLLGKPIEGIRTDELLPLLKDTDNYPMHRYILSNDITEEIQDKYLFCLEGKCWADTVDAAPIDDDTNYTVMAQLIIEKYGRDFTSNDVGRSWLALQPIEAYFTAERIAFCNMIDGYLPPDSAKYKNPCREWIGAQIRGDYYGYINPGDPETAADMAWRDASVSHVKNGIYGEMFVSAMLACAAVADSIKDVILGGLAQIPATSRLYRDVMHVFNNYINSVSAEETFAQIHEKYDEFTDHGWCHTLSNSMIVTAALLYGECDYGKSVCLAVQTGFDTDCNGATVGSVLGRLLGAEAIGDEWTRVINGKLKTSLIDVGTVEVEKLVAKTIKHIK